MAMIRRADIKSSEQSSHRVRVGGVYGGRRAWAEVLPWVLCLARMTYLGATEAIPTEPDVRGFLR